MAENINGVVGGIQKFSTEDGPGIRTTVFLKGCPLKCVWCHNSELISKKVILMHTPSRCIMCRKCSAECPVNAITYSLSDVKIDRLLCNACMKCTCVCHSLALKPVGEIMTVNQVISKVVQDIGFYNKSGGGMTISGGEPLNQVDFTEALIDRGKNYNLNIALDTSGFGNSAQLLRLSKKVDIILYDIKSVDDNKHLKLTGVSNKLILKNLSLLASDDSVRSKIIVRLPLIGGLNDEDNDILAVRGYLKDIKINEVNLIPYHEFGVSKSIGIGENQERYSTPSDKRLFQITSIFNNVGINAIFAHSKN